MARRWSCLVAFLLCLSGVCCTRLDSQGTGVVEEAGLLELRSERASPPFRPEIFENLAAPLNVPSTASCGEPLQRMVTVVGSSRGLMRTRVEQVFHLLTPKNAWKVMNPSLRTQERDDLVKSLAGTGEDLRVYAVSSVARISGLPLGFELLRVGDVHGPFQSISQVGEALDKVSGSLEMSFQAGLDMRSCWGDVHDLDGRPICGQVVMEEMLGEVPNLKPELDETGQSGSTLITNLRSFIVKNAKDMDEYDVLARVAPNIGKEMKDRAKTSGSCWSTAIAPICAVLIEPGNTRWLAMRKITTEGERKMLTLDGTGIPAIDLKGPKFTGSRDGKSALTKWSPSLAKRLHYKSDLWKGKDPGFVQLFPEGITLAGCGSRDAEIAFTQDTAMLASLGMTDYSFFGSFFEPQLDEDGPHRQFWSPSGKCMCDDAEHPRFPLVLRVSTESAVGAQDIRDMRIVAGIIDWIERSYHTAPIVADFSTMRAPDVYKEWYMRMWGMYFHVPEREAQKIAPSRVLITPMDHQQGELLTYGDTVMAITKIKWTSRKASMTFAGVTQKLHYEQMRETSSRKPVSGSTHKVLPGDRGRLLALTGEVASLLDKYPASLVVAWDSIEGLTFRVQPDQVVGVERHFAAGSTDQ